LDKLRNIDQLLKNSLEGKEINTPSLSDDWLAIEQRLRQRKNRIYAMWFSLALILVSSSVAWYVYESADATPYANESEALIEQTVETPEESVVQQDPVLDQSIFPYDNTINEQTAPSPLLNSTQVTPSRIAPVEETSVEETTTPVGIEEVIANNKSIDFSTEVAGPEVEQLTISEVEVLEPKSGLTGSVDPTKSVRNGHWEVGVSITPSFTDKITSTNKDLGGLVNKSFRDIVNSSEQASFAYNTSFNVGYHWSNGFFINSGIGISERAEQVDYDYVITETVKVDEVKNEIKEYTPRHPDFHTPVSYSGSNSYHFVEIPLTLGHTWKLTDKWLWRNQIGASYMLLTNSLGKKPDYTYLELLNLEEVDYFNKSNVSASVKSGIYYNFKRFVIGAEPIVGLNLNSLSNEQSAIQVQPYYYGFNLTTQFKLGISE
jgi:hypothetical protein